MVPNSIGIHRYALSFPIGVITPIGNERLAHLSIKTKIPKMSSNRFHRLKRMSSVSDVHEFRHPIFGSISKKEVIKIIKTRDYSRKKWIRDMMEVSFSYGVKRLPNKLQRREIRKSI